MQPIYEFTTLFRQKFFQDLERKTGWGKEEVKRLFDENMALTATYLIDRYARESDLYGTPKN